LLSDHSRHVKVVKAVKAVKAVKLVKEVKVVKAVKVVKVVKEVKEEKVVKAVMIVSAKHFCVQTFFFSAFTREFEEQEDSVQRTQTAAIDGITQSINLLPNTPRHVLIMMPHLCDKMKKAIFWEDTPRATRRNIQEDGILHIHRRGNLKSYIALTGWTL
jgi:hypothetical protein